MSDFTQEFDIFFSREQVAVLDNLHPYFLYLLSVKALATDQSTQSNITLPEESSIIGETLQDKPQVTPVASAIPPR